ncbi:MAG: Rap1a immunity protein [Herminiimonas sp.]|jgi:hypothetical protein|nr:Rap1a immunity protein [Herminiimonas sp.]
MTKLLFSRRFLPAASLLLCTLFAGGNARADYYWKGSTLLQHLDEEARGVPSFEVAVALGYVTGVVDTLDSLVVCSPPDVKLRETTRVVYDYLKGHPQMATLPAHRAIAEALGDAWPCAKKEGNK